MLVGVSSALAVRQRPAVRRAVVVRPIARGGLTTLGDPDVPSLAQTQAAAQLRQGFQSVLDAVKAALKAAQALTGVDASGKPPDQGFFSSLFSTPGQIPSGTPSSVVQAWIGVVVDATTSTKDGVPFLASTLDKAVADASGYGKRWLDTAKALRSELTQVLSDDKNVGYLNGIDSSIAATASTIDDFVKKDVLPKVLPNFGLALGIGVALIGGFVAWKVFS